MSLHIFGAVITGYGCAANNRGKTEGNITVLQKLIWKGQVHTTVSSEAIRWAMRYYWQQNEVEVNRQWDDEKEDHTWQDSKWEGWRKKGGKIYIDDDLLGFMKLPIAKRRGMLEVCRAISTTPYVGDITFNAKSGEKERTSLYGTEMHATRYQYGFALTPARLREPDRALDALSAVAALGEVAGNHSRYLFDFSPDSIVLRVTQDPAPRILYIFEEQDGQVGVPELLRKVEAGDIDPKELFIGGRLARQEGIQNLGAAVCEPGVKKAVEACKEEIQKQLNGEVENA